MVVIARINKILLFFVFIVVSGALLYLLFQHVGGASANRSLFYPIMGEFIYILMYGSLIIIEYIIIRIAINSNSYIYWDSGIFYFGGNKVGNFSEIKYVSINRNLRFNASLILVNNKNRKFIIKSILLKENVDYVRDRILDLGKQKIT